MGDRTIEAKADNPLFQHEYGHYLQSRAKGWLYLPKYGVPSMISANRGVNHKCHSTEQDANARALNYFGKKKGADFIQSGGWKFDNNPIKGYNKNENFNSKSNMQVLNNALIGFHWLDVFPVNWIPIINLPFGFVYEKSYNNQVP